MPDFAEDGAKVVVVMLGVLLVMLEVMGVFPPVRRKW